MVETREVTIEGKTFTYLKMDMEKAPLVIIKGNKGYVMCGYLNMETADKLGDIAVRVKGVKDADTILSSKVEAVSVRAKEIGIDVGMPVRAIISKL
ncbi:MAG: YunC family protein [Thermoplasmataceae archaeon]